MVVEVEVYVTKIWYQVLDDGRVEVNDLQEEDDTIKDLDYSGESYRCLIQKDLKFVNCTIDTIDHDGSLSLDSCTIKKVKAVGYILLKNCKNMEVETTLNVLARNCENVKIKARGVCLYDTLTADLTVVDKPHCVGSEATRGKKTDIKVTRVGQKKAKEAAEAKKSETKPS